MIEFLKCTKIYTNVNNVTETSNRQKISILDVVCLLIKLTKCKLKKIDICDKK